MKKWIPSLAKVNDIEAVLRPWDFSITGFQNPVVDPLSQLTWEDLNRLKETNKLTDTKANDSI